MSNDITQNPNDINLKKGDNFYRGVMTWLAIALGVAASAAYIIGPLVPPSFILPLSIIMIIVLIGASFSRKVKQLSSVFIFAVPAVLGILIYPVLNNMIGSGSGGIIVQALAGTVIVFGTAAVLGWKSDKNMQGWHGPLFAIVLGIIGLSLMNTFLFQLPMMSLLISIAVLVVFTIYSFIDVQAIRKRAYGDESPQFYALQIFLDIYNIFAALLNILR